MGIHRKEAGHPPARNAEKRIKFMVKAILIAAVVMLAALPYGYLSPVQAEAKTMTIQQALHNQKKAGCSQ
ncbi:hypothetical protein L3476_21870 [Paenibacillus thiaminolyticus]|uniref:hypothetical protein n=1 Tax=Paenibacillus thiaminolyticus TaxID=49283 RepID=UPI00234FEF6B|nr:hypothetical protein [Paenibacillus thiaminolyticus]WCR25914.1 hypothetical protein L3476_21870 [Paenibacillus thiaminolyticus]